MRPPPLRRTGCPAGAVRVRALLLVAGALAALAAVALLLPGRPLPGEGPSVGSGAPRVDGPRAERGSGSGPGSGDAAGPRWTDTVRVASGDGYVGPWRMNESDWRYVDDATVALAGDGTAAVAWVDQSRKDVFLQLYGPGGASRLDAPVNVSRSPDVFSWLPRVVITGEDPPEIFVLWQEIVFSGGSHGGEAYFARSDDGGNTFGEPVNLSRTPAGDGKGRLTPERWDNGSLDLARGPGGTLFAAWTEYEGALWLRTSEDGGRSFTEKVRVGGDDDAPARGPSVAAGPDGTVHVAWSAGGAPGADLRLSTSRDGGRSFGETRRVLESQGHSDVVRVALDGTGRLHLVHGESPGGPLRRYHVRYARSPDGGRSWEGHRRISGAPGEQYRGAHGPALGLDSDGTVYVLWELYPSDGERRRGLAITRSTDGGESFADPRVVPGTAAAGRGFNGSLQGILGRKLSVAPGNGLAVVNSRFRPFRGSRIRLIRGIWPDG